MVAFSIAFILGGVRVDSELSWPMLALWVAVGVALGFGLPPRKAVVTGLVYGSCLGFASTLYGDPGQLLFIERIAGIFAGVPIGAFCGALVAAIGSRLTRSRANPPTTYGSM